MNAMARNVTIAALIAVLLFGLVPYPARAAHTGLTGNIWGITASFGLARIQQWDPVTHAKVTDFSSNPIAGQAQCNGRGISFDGVGALWYSCTINFGAFDGDGVIHKIGLGGGSDILTIPDNGLGASPGYGFGGRGIGAIDLHTGTGNIWVISYKPINNLEEIRELTPAGALVSRCDVPFGGGGVGTETLTVDETAGTFLTNAAEPLFFLDEYVLPVGSQGACTLVANYNPTPVRIGGIDFDINGNLANSEVINAVLGGLGTRPFSVVVGSFVGDAAIEDITFLTPRVIVDAQVPEFGLESVLMVAFILPVLLLMRRRFR